MAMLDWHICKGSKRLPYFNSLIFMNGGHCIYNVSSLDHKKFWKCVSPHRHWLYQDFLLCNILKFQQAAILYPTLDHTFEWWHYFCKDSERQLRYFLSFSIIKDKDIGFFFLNSKRYWNLSSHSKFSYLFYLCFAVEPQIEECENYSGSNFFKRFSDVAEWIGDCDCGASWIGDINLELVLLISMRWIKGWWHLHD